MNTDHILLQATLEPCWLWWLIFSALAFILGALLGCLLCSNRKRLKELEGENSGLHAKLTNMEKDFVSLKYQYEEAQKDLSNMRTSLQRCQADKAVLSTKLEKCMAEKEPDKPETDTDAGAGTTSRSFGAGAVVTPPASKDDLKKVEGIGPKIEELLNAAGIYTFQQLAETAVEKVKAILDEAGPRYRLADPGSWAKQAALAASGKWDELQELQDQLKGGK
ncbi:MAG: hypothetical protein KDD02_00060 [Phaeodactylibacter sp.]|nr:hypothetical protein [Phaeodactylibacter sp.]MCB9303840.1 hypothetical protein [Lewinellaceae bacterium]